jgi:hypothetical protein
MVSLRFPLLAAVACAAIAAAPAGAQNMFDLAGPTLAMSVTRGATTLPIAQVPALAGGDRLSVKANLPEDQSAHYMLIVAFLRGATNPPPDKWFFKADTWNKKAKKNSLTIDVPEGADQAIAFLAPDTGGGFDAVRDAVQGRPGVFVRATQDLQQASLDRARLEAFVAGVARVEKESPERLAQVSPRLAEALAIKLDAACLSKPRAAQAACLTQKRDGMVLQTGRGTSLTETLTGAPTEIVASLANTREGGAGFYSPYIALARDVAKLFGAFRSADYQYVPALGIGDGSDFRLQLNTAPSFQNPKSVLVVPLPPIGAIQPPVLRAAVKDGVCLMRPGMALPLEDAPLIYATDYARDLSMRITTADARTMRLPVTADAERGGLVVRPPADGSLGGSPITSAVLEGNWGFAPFAGPRFPLQNGVPAAWTADPATVVVGRDHPLLLRGGASSCVEQVALRDGGGGVKTLEWKPSAPDELGVTLPLARTKPGALTLLVSQYGVREPASLTLTAQVEASRLDGFTLHAGDSQGVLSGGRLDQVAELTLGSTRFAPGALTRGEGGDRLVLAATGDAPATTAGASLDAKVKLRDGRSVTLPVTVAAARPRIELVSRNVDAPAPPPGRIALSLPEATLPPEARLVFSVRGANVRFAPGDAIEIATADGNASTRLTIASGALQLVGGDVAVGSLEPLKVLGPGAVGALRMRLVQGDLVGDWQPLAQVVRLPQLDAVVCEKADACSLSASGLFLVDRIAATPDFAGATSVPAGFVGGRVDVPKPTGDALYLRLRDAPDAVVKATLPAAK